MMVLPFMTIYLTSSLGFSIAQAGIVVAFFGIGSFIGSYSGGLLSDRIGYFKVQLLSLVLGGIACVSLAWIKSFWGLCIAMMGTSALLDMLRPSMTAAISSFAKPENVTRSFSLVRMAINLGAGVGPAVAGILVGISYSFIFIGDGVTSIAAGVVLYFYFHAKIKASTYTKKKISIKSSPLQSGAYLMFIILCLLYAVVFFQLFCTLPLYYDQVHHIEKKFTGYLIALNGLIVFTFEMMLVFKLENSVHPKKVIMTGVFLGGLGLIMLNYFHSNWALVVSMIVLSFSEIFAMPFMMTVAVAKADASNRGIYTGIYASAWSAAFIVAPIVGTSIITHFGFSTLWWSMGILSLFIMAGFWKIVPLVYKKVA
jgi:MFS family permease